MPITPSQRILLVRKITERLSLEEFDLIDLTLKSFSLPIRDTWSGSKESYVMTNVSGGSDDCLLDLGQHLGYEVGLPASSRLEPAFWHKGMFRLFISHLATHREWVGRLQATLLHFGITSFVAHNDIAPTSEWQDQIELGLATCDGLVALLHEGFHKSKWTDQEIGFAMGRSVPVFSVRFGEDPYGFIGRSQAFNGRDKEPINLSEEIFDAFRKNKQTQKKIADTMIGFFEESSTYAEAKSRMALLERMQTWNGSYTRRIEAASEANSQIRESYGVLERVKALNKKWTEKTTAIR